MSPRSPTIALVLCVLATGCGDGAKPPVQMEPTGCAKMKAECLDTQQGCVEDAMGVAKCVPCGAGQYAALSGACEAIPGTPIVHDYADFTVKSGHEVLGLCQSWTLHNATELWVNAVELAQDEASHHSNWTFVPNTKFDGPDGVWKCNDRGYSQLDAALVGGVLYAQSTQAAREVQRFPNGAAVRIPPYSRIIGDVHLLNASPKDVTGHARITIYTLPAADVKVPLTPFHLTYSVLAIPPRARSRFTGECWIGDSFSAAQSVPWDLRIYYILPHTHAMGRRFFMDVLGGPKDGQPIYDMEGFNGEARGRAYNPPIDLGGAGGIRFGCEFQNDRDVTVGWGFGDQEMCEMLGFAETKMVFESSVLKANPDGADGLIQKFNGPCTSLLFDWDFNRPGGSPP